MSNIFKQSLIKIRAKLLGSVNDLPSLIMPQITDIQKQQRELSRIMTERFDAVDSRQQRESFYGTVGVYAINEREIATKLFNDLIMYLDPHDIAVVPHIILERIWEREITWAWLNVVDSLNKRDGVILDIGANFGYYALISAQRVDKKKANVVLFEPNPNLIPYINKTLSVNWLKENTTVENLGVSDKNGEVTLNILEDYTGSSSMHSIKKLDAYLSHKMHIKAEQQVKAKVVAIDDYCEQHSIDRIELAKMDIEGYEEKAYAGMHNIVKKSPELILFIEFTKDGYEDPKGFYQQMLKDFGHIYTIGQEGELIKPQNISYKALIEPENDWIMLVFSKRSLNTKA